MKTHQQMSNLLLLGYSALTYELRPENHEAIVTQKKEKRQC